MAQKPSVFKEVLNPNTKDLPRPVFEHLYPEQKTVKIIKGVRGATEPIRRKRMKRRRVGPTEGKMKKIRKQEGGFLAGAKEFFTGSGKLFGITPTKPKSVVGKGGADQFGKIVRRKSVKEQAAEKAKTKTKKITAAKTTPANVDTTKRSYGDVAGKGKGAGANTVTATSFGAAFKIARKQLGAGKTFTYKGKKYTTDRADDKKKKTTTVAGPVQGPPKQPKKLSSVERRRQARKNRNKRTDRTDRGASVRRRTRGRNVNDFKTITSKQSGIPDTQPFNEGGFASMDDYMKDLL
tara:strand:+ start:64 stop:942 length:879 start_codon:yes stop_codon:yes gene_type:complete